MKKGMNENIKSVIVLTAICLVITGLLAVTNSFTAPIIEATRGDQIQQSLTSVLPNAGGFDKVEELPGGAPETVTAVYMGKDGSYAVVLATRSSYSSGDMGITVGVDANGQIVNAVITSYQESKDFGRDTYPENYIGTSLSTYAEVDTYADVTYSSEAFRNAIGDAFAVIELLNNGGAVA